MNSGGGIDPGVVGGELAAELLPWTRLTLTPFTGDATPLVGRYTGPSRGREMVIEVTQTAQGLAVSANGSPARPLPWTGGWTFRHGNSFLTFRRTGDAGPATQLRFDGGPGSYYILKRQ